MERITQSIKPIIGHGSTHKASPHPGSLNIIFLSFNSFDALIAANLDRNFSTFFTLVQLFTGP